MKEGRKPVYPEKTPDDEPTENATYYSPKIQAPSETRTRTLALVASQESRRANPYTTRLSRPTCLGPLCSVVSAALDRLVGLVVRRPPRERKIQGSNPACAGIFSGSSHTSDLKIGTPVATLPGAWRYRVSAGTGRPGVSIL